MSAVAVLGVVLASLLTGSIFAAEDQAAAAPVAQESIYNSDFLHYHPDIRNRLDGINSLERKAYSQAFSEFMEAARFADKPSQAAIAEMLWEGKGVQRDRARAYAWMDLAAERGHKSWVVFREHYWEQLDADERNQALTVGQQIYSEFGDEVAKARLEHMLRKRRMNFTGSRTGFVGNMKILVPIDGIWSYRPSHLFYDKKFWFADDYWEWQDEIWRKPPEGVVTVDGPRPMREPADKPNRNRESGTKDGAN